MKKNKKHKFSIRKLIYNDKYLIICSVIAAVIIWIITAMNLSPETTKKISVPVTVDFSGTLAEQLGIEYFDNDEITVDVTVSCKKYLAMDISENDIRASLQTSTVTSTGYHSVPIYVSSNDENAEFTIISYFPTSAEGFYDVAEEKAFPVDINFTNSGFAADGYVAGDTSLNSNSVTVRGPRTYMSFIDKVVANIELQSNLTESQVVNLEPVALDTNGNKVDYVSVNSTEDGLIATVPILKVRTLQPNITLINGPDNILDIVDIMYSVDYIEAGVLESTDVNSLELGNLDVSELSVGKNQFTFETSSISGITVLDGTSEVVVTITVPDSYATKRISFLSEDIFLNDSKRRIISISSHEVIIVGDENALNSVDKSNLSFGIASIDGAEITTGTTECYITVYVKDINNCWIYNNRFTARVKTTE